MGQLRTIALLMVALAALPGCNSGSRSTKKSESSTSAAVASNGNGFNGPDWGNGTGNGSNGLGGPGNGTAQGSLDPDHDGLTNDEEALFGTDPNNPDTDGDGIIDGRDLAPLFGAASYGPFELMYPRGAVHTQHDYQVAGLFGRSRVEKWLAGYKETYKGTRGTRSSEITEAKVKAEIDELTKQSEFTAVSVQGKGSLDRFDGHQYKKTFFPSRYTIDYDFKQQSYEVAFRNSQPVTVRDDAGDAFANRVFPVTVRGSSASTLTIQFAVDKPADLYLDTPTHYVVPALTFQVFDGNDPYTATVVADDVAVGSPLNEHAYEVRVPLPTAAGSQTADWTVAITPVWVEKQDGQDAKVSAIDAGVLRIGAVAHDQTLSNSSQGNNGQATSSRLTGIFPTLQDLATDLRAEAAQRTFGQQVIDDKTVISQAPATAGQPQSAREWTLSIVQTTARISQLAIGTLIQVDEFTNYTSGQDLALLMNPDQASRYGEIVEQLQKLNAASSAVIHGMTAVVMAEQGDTIRATLYAARSVTEVFRAVGDTELIRAGAAAASFATNIYEAYDAFRGGDNLRGGMYVARATVDVLSAFDSELAAGGAAILGGATEGLNAYNAFRQGDTVLGLVHVARGSGALARFFLRNQEIMGIPAGSVITAALGVVDVGYNIYRATQQNDPIIKQRYIEDAVASAVDTAIFLIPTVGPVIQVVWQVGWQALTWIFPDLAKFRMFRSPGAFLTFVGQVFFTNTIPSAYAEEAYEDAAKDFIQIMEDRQAAGELVLAIFPEIN